MSIFPRSGIKIAILYAEIQAYNIPVIQKMIHKWNAEVWVIRWTQNIKIEFNPSEMDGLKIESKSQYDHNSLLDALMAYQPDIIITSGWMDSMYISVCRIIRRKTGIPIVAMSDTSWRGNFRQRVAQLIFPLFYKPAFSHIAIAGPAQKSYAKKLGFSDSEILVGCYSADLDLFNTYYKQVEVIKKNTYPHRFLFIGRFAKEKGIEMLLAAWEQLESRKDWELQIVGKGPIKVREIVRSKNLMGVHVSEFIDQHNLHSVIETSGCLIVPSIFEPWSVTIHEFAAAGLPIISSSVCGANCHFVKHKINGRIFQAHHILALKSALQELINSDDPILLDYSKKSHELAQQLNPEMIADAQLSPLRKKN